MKLYVPAELSDIKSVTLEIGTGFFVEKSIPKAGEYVERRVKFIKQQLESLHKDFNTKKLNLEKISYIINKKYNELIMQQQK